MRYDHPDLKSENVDLVHNGESLSTGLNVGEAELSEDNSELCGIVRSSNEINFEAPIECYPIDPAVTQELQELGCGSINPASPFDSPYSYVVNSHGIDLLMNGGVLSKYWIYLLETDPRAISDLMKTATYFRTGAPNAYWIYELGTDKELVPGWMDFFKKQPLFLKYAPADVQQAVKAATIEDEDFQMANDEIELYPAGAPYFVRAVALDGDNTQESEIKSEVKPNVEVRPIETSGPEPIKRKRGRPPKIKPEASAPTTIDPPLTPVKKKRGRPAKKRQGIITGITSRVSSVNGFSFVGDSQAQLQKSSTDTQRRSNWDEYNAMSSADLGSDQEDNAVHVASEPDIMSFVKAETKSDGDEKETAKSTPTDKHKSENLVSKKSKLANDTPVIRKRKREPNSGNTRPMKVQVVTNPSGQPEPTPMPAITVPTRATRVRNRNKGGQFYSFPPGRLAMWEINHPGEALPDIANIENTNPLDTVCPPASVNILFLGAVMVTAVELLTFFPLHSLWRWVMWRYHSNEWKPSMMVKFITWSRGLTDTKAILRSTLAHQVSTTTKWAKVQEPPLAEGHVSKFDMLHIPADRGLYGINKTLEDYRLVDLANGVKQWPQGKDRQLLTAAIELAVRRGDKTTLGGFQQYVKDNLDELNRGLVPMTSGNENPDIDARDRHWPIVERYAKGIGYSSY